MSLFKTADERRDDATKIAQQFLNPGENIVFIEGGRVEFVALTSKNRIICRDSEFGESDSYVFSIALDRITALAVRVPIFKFVPKLPELIIQYAGGKIVLKGTMTAEQIKNVYTVLSHHLYR